MPKNPCLETCPKKGGHHAYSLSHELQIQTVNSKTWTVCSKFELLAPILNHELQLSTVSSNYQPWAPILNPELHRTYSQIHKNLQIELSKKSRDNVQIHYSFFIIYYMYFIFIIYVFYFYYMLFYII